MRRLIIAVAIMLIGFSWTCFGRELVNPDTLTFKKTYSMPGMTKDELYEYARKWKGEDIRLDDRYGDWRHKEKDYHINFDGQVLESTTADIDGDVFLRFRDGEFDLIFTNIGAVWKNNFVVDVNTRRSVQSNLALESIKKQADSESDQGTLGRIVQGDHRLDGSLP